MSLAVVAAVRLACSTCLKTRARINIKAIIFEKKTALTIYKQKRMQLILCFCRLFALVLFVIVVCFECFRFSLLSHGAESNERARARTQYAGHAHHYYESALIAVSIHSSFNDEKRRR